MSLRIKKAGRFTAFLLLPLLIAAGVFLGSKYFKISYVSVSGNTTVPEEEILELAAVPHDLMIFMLDEDEVKERVERNPILKVIGVERIFPNKVRIHLVEREPRVELEFAGGFMILDSEAHILSISQTTESKLPLIRGVEPTAFVVGQALETDEDKKYALSELLKVLGSQDGFDKIKSIDLSDAKDIVVYHIPDFSIIYGLPYDLDLKANLANAIINDCEKQGISGGRIDVRDAANKKGYFSSPQISPSPEPSLGPSPEPSIENEDENA
ncbi:MAG TPA: FtsQ-type POTRA domain-containing protein [Clostridia bacterium]|nr:FtsQ-type POTRA domain-containing protein [Clostridia bacterium]